MCAHAIYWNEGELGGTMRFVRNNQEFRTEPFPGS